MFAGFQQHKVKLSGAEINFRRAGDGPPLLLLHGYPQTHAMWHAVAPALARRFTVIAADLRGYGDSSKPPGDAAHRTYSKRAMGEDMLALMATLGWTRFALVGHDRGARVGHRLALDRPEAITKLAVLDIVPTHSVWTNMDWKTALSTYHWLFLAQPGGLPERLIGLDPAYYLRETLARWAAPGFAFAPEALAEYIRCFRDPAAIHAACEDYRAGASVDMEYDAADRGRRYIECPVLAVSSQFYLARRSSDILGAWRPWARDVRGHAISGCGHFVAEEAPDETLKALEAFL